MNDLGDSQIKRRRTMSWLPAFEIGLWNAWIFMLFIALLTLIMILVGKAVGTGNIYKKMGDVPTEKGEKRANAISTAFMLLLFAYSIFLPLKLGTAWFYAGLMIYLMGLVMFLSAIVTVAKTPMGQIFSQGMYRFSRHPLYLSFLIIFAGVSVASTSWVFLLLSVGWIIFPVHQITAEERGCIEAFGVEYQEYMNITPRWLGIPKSR
jgi:protein-S-isoprenylcysteine O-methyltransferase Ste14